MNILNSVHPVYFLGTLPNTNVKVPRLPRYIEGLIPLLSFDLTTVRFVGPLENRDFFYSPSKGFDFWIEGDDAEISMPITEKHGFMNPKFSWMFGKGKMFGLRMIGKWEFVIKDQNCDDEMKIEAFFDAQGRKTSVWRVFRGREIDFFVFSKDVLDGDSIFFEHGMKIRYTFSQGKFLNRSIQFD